MTNEEMVAAIQEGRESLLPELWQNIERFVKKIANRYINYDGGFAEFDDLYNAGYIALAGAVKTYRAEAGMSFVCWLAFYLKREFAVARYGGKAAKNKIDPLNYAASLDAPLDGEDLGSETLGDTVADPNNDIVAAEDRIYNEQLNYDLFQAIQRLPELEQDLIRARYFQGATISQIALDFNMAETEARTKCDHALSRLRHPTLSHRLRRYIDDQTKFYRNSGFSSFKNTGSSSIERTVMEREEMEESISAAQNIQTIF